jgi:hypothetical protein
LFTEPFMCGLRGEVLMSYHQLVKALISRGGSTNRTLSIVTVICANLHGTLRIASV